MKIEIEVEDEKIPQLKLSIQKIFDNEELRSWLVTKLLRDVIQQIGRKYVNSN